MKRKFTLVLCSLLTFAHCFTFAQNRENNALPLTATMPEKWGRIELGSSVAIYPIVTGGVYPYQYTWENDQKEIIGTDSVLTVTPTQLSHYTLIVKDFSEKRDTLSTVVYVNGNIAVANFENLYLASESYWKGPEGNTETNVESKFYNGSFSFSNTRYDAWLYWGGYAYSNVTSTSFDPLNFDTQQFRSVVGHGVDNSPNYSVVYAMGARTDIEVTNKENGDVIPGVYLTNAAYTYHSILNGDSFSGDPFVQGDWYKVIFKGTKADGTITSKEIYLADYRDANPANHFVVTNWKWCDLSSLGAVKKVRVTVDGSRKNKYGLTTPAYFCMDNFGAIDSTSGNLRISSTKLEVFPNPFADYIIIQSDKIQSLKLFNVSGQLIRSTTVSEGENRLNTESLPRGSYILQCGNEVMKLIK